MPLRFVTRQPIAPRLMLWYLRALAVFYFISGLGHWAGMIGLAGPPLDETARHEQVATVYFAVLEVVAAVGLWSGAAWGVAAWLFAAVAQLVIHVGFADLFGEAWGIVAFHIIAILTYVGLAWWAGTPENTGEVLRLPPE